MDFGIEWYSTPLNLVLYIIVCHSVIFFSFLQFFFALPSSAFDGVPASVVRGGCGVRILTNCFRR